MIRSWHLGDDRQSLVLASFDDRLPEAVYWGPALPTGENLETLSAAALADVTGGMVDRNAGLSLCPEASESFPGQTGLTARNASGAPLMPSFRFESEAASEHGLTLVFADNSLDLSLVFDLVLTPETSLLMLQTRLESADEITVDWLAAPVLPVPAHTAR